MRLLKYNFEFCDYDDKPPPYAILSHTWSENNQEEVSYQDLRDGTTKSLLKLELCRDWAKAAGLKYFWIDTCCIDKRNDAEINYAIRSMWRWYKEADVCFVYLSDLSMKRKRDADRDNLKNCRWFTRGWTLQELVASKKVEFYASDGYLGSREDLLPTLTRITGINLSAPMPSHATRLSWVAKRETKRPEDKAYCMLGICNVSLIPQYGEGGEAAWRRLQAEIRMVHGTIALEPTDTLTSDHRSTVLEALRFDALETRRKTVKVALAKTCRWILDHPACSKWLKREHKFFWIKGKPGVGKSVLIKYLDQHVTGKLKPTGAIGLYFYFNARGAPLEKSFTGLYRSLLVQLLDLVPELTHVLDPLDTDFSLPQLQGALRSAILKLDRRIWLFIDALDECREDARDAGDVQELVEFLKDLKGAELYVCFASRHYPIVEIPAKLQLVLEKQAEHEKDLITYIMKLNLEGEELAQMQSEIIAKANGIFLWVVLVVGILQQDVLRGRFHAMQSRLESIPEGLPELFKSIVLRDDEHKDEFLLCLQWILYSQRPLTLKEWYFAMMAGLQKPLEWTPKTKDDRMETFLLSSSKGLAELTRGKMITAQFIHESVREFLTKEDGLRLICDDDKFHESFANEQLKQCCLRGLAFDLPERPPQQKKGSKWLLTEEDRNSLKAKYPFAEYATTYILHHADQADVTIPQNSFLINLLHDLCWVDRFNALQKSKPEVYGTQPSCSYICAERNLTSLIRHATTALLVSEEQRYGSPLIAAIVNSSWDVVTTFLVDLDAQDIDETIAELKDSAKFTLLPRRLLHRPLFWSVRNGLERLSAALLKASNDADAGEATQALLLAMCSGKRVIVDHILTTFPSSLHTEAAISVFYPSVDFEGYPLTYASEVGSKDFVEACIRFRADVNAQSMIPKESALYLASLKGNSEVVELLLEAGADVHAAGGYYGNALQAASYGGSTIVVQILLDAGANFHTAGGVYGNALQAASCNGSTTVVRLLLDAGADVHAAGGRYGNALQAASYSGNTTVVQMLLDAGADVYAAGGVYGNALQAASYYGNTTVVQLLLDAGADVHAVGGVYGTALQAASYRGLAAVVQILLEAGADVHAVGGEYGNALQAASYGGSATVVQMLLDAGADVNAAGGYYGNALQAALYGGSTSVEQLLLDAGADVHAAGGYFGTALNATFSNGEVANLIRDAGAT